jgi:hypothetical protein
MTPACQRKQTTSALDSQPGMPGRRGSRSGLHRDVAAAGSIPADPTEQEARVLPERRACRSQISHHKCSAPLSGDAPRDPRRNPVAPSTSTRVPAGNLRCQRKLSVPQACCHTRDGPACSPPSDGNPNAAEPRIERAETRPLRSPTTRGDLDANADANRHLTNCRPDTADHPQSIGSCDVATTILPTKRERHWECAELWHTPGTRAIGLPQSPCVPRLPLERRARQAGPDAFRRPPQTNDLSMLPNRLSVDSDAATGHDDVATAMGFPPGPDDRDVMRATTLFAAVPGGCPSP